jgi:hypothetical protein
VAASGGDGGPVGLCARHPRAAQRAQKDLGVVRALLRVADRAGYLVRGGAGGVLAEKRAQDLARPDLERHEVALHEERPRTLGEADGAAQVADPVVGVGRLGLGDPCAGKVRHEGQGGREKRDPVEGRAEFGEDWLDHRRMGSHVDVDAAGFDFVGGETGGERLDGADRAGDHALADRVDRGDGECGVELVGHRFGRKGNAQHRTFGERVEEPAAAHDDVERVGFREDARDAGGGVFAHAVADHGRRLHAPGHPLPRHRVFDGEEGGERRPRLVERGVAAPDDVEKARPRAGAVVRVEPVYRLAEGGEAGVEVRRHACVLRAAAGEEEGDARFFARKRGAEKVLRVAGTELRDRLGQVADDERHALLEPTAAGEEGVGDVGKVRLRMAFEPVGKVGRTAGERRVGPR